MVHPSERAAGKDIDVIVYVTAEVIKPEDADAIAAARQPLLAVLNKADLAGSLSGRTGDGPIAAARTRCLELSERVGVPVEPMIGLLAVAALDGLDDAAWAALQVLAAHPSGAESLDGSIRRLPGGEKPGACRRAAALAGHPGPVRHRAGNRRGPPGQDAGAGPSLAAADQLRGRRRQQGVGRSAPKCATSGCSTPSRNWRHWPSAATRLASGSAGSSPTTTPWSRGWPPRWTWPRRPGWTSGGATIRPDTCRGRRGGSATAAGPVSDLHRACGADIARGSLRLWSQTCGSLPEPHAESR